MAPILFDVAVRCLLVSHLDACPPPAKVQVQLGEREGGRERLTDDEGTLRREITRGEPERDTAQSRCDL